MLINIQLFYEEVLTSSLGHAVVQSSGDLKRVGEVSKPGPGDAYPDSGSVTWYIGIEDKCEDSYLSAICLWISSASGV